MAIQRRKLAAFLSGLLLLCCQRAVCAADPVADQNAARTLALIKQQAAEVSSRRQSDFNNVAKAKLSIGNGTAAQLQLECNTIVSEMSAARIFDGHGRSVPVYSQAQIQSVADDYARRIADVNFVSGAEAQRATALGNQASQTVDDVLEGLASQINSSGGSSSVKLLPQGTNLYVRNYSESIEPVKSRSEPAQDMPAELLATQEKLLLNAKNRSRSNLGKSDLKPDTDLDVRGRMLSPRVR